MNNPYMDGSAGKRLLVAVIILGLFVLITGSYNA